MVPNELNKFILEVQQAIAEKKITKGISLIIDHAEKNINNIKSLDICSQLLNEIVSLPIVSVEERKSILVFWIRNLKKSILIDPNYNNSYAYKLLPNIYRAYQRYDISPRAFDIAYASKAIGIKVFDVTSNVNSSIYKSIIKNHNINIPHNSTFLPSKIVDEPIKGMHLFHVHIMKSGGHRFNYPLQTLLNFYLNYENLLQQKIPLDYYPNILNNNKLSFYAPGSLYPDELEGAIKYFNNNSTQLDISLTSTHNTPHKDIWNAISKSIGIKIHRFAIYRNPIERMASFISYKHRQGVSISSMKDMINSRHIHFDNNIYRHCFSCFKGEISENKKRNIEIDSIIKIENYSLLSKLQSLFLSCCQLPNIITDKVINTNPRKTIQDDQLQSLVDLAIQNGLIGYDQHQDIKDKITNQLPFDISRYESGDLHPLTFILKTKTKTTAEITLQKLVPTSFLQTKSGEIMLSNIFSPDKQ